MRIRAINKNEIIMDNIQMTIKDGIILTISYYDNSNNATYKIRLDEVRSINAINGFDIRKDDRYRVASQGVIKGLLDNLNLSDCQNEIINLMVNQNYKHNLLLDIALEAFQYKEKNLMEEKIKASITIEEMRAILLNHDLSNSLENKTEGKARKI